MAGGDRVYDQARDKKWASEVYQRAKEVASETLRAGGSVVAFAALCDAVRAKYPTLCDESIKDRSSPKAPYWKHIVASALAGLKQAGRVVRADGGWRWVGAGPPGPRPTAPTPPPPPPPGDAERLAKEIRDLAQELAVLAKSSRTEPRLTHDELIQKVKEVGQMLGKTVEVGWGPIYRFDCVWKDNPYANPRLAVEVCDKGNLDKDIASLHWAEQNWGAKGILVAVEEGDFQAAKKKVARGSQTHPLRARDMVMLHLMLSEGNTEAVRCIFGV